jgi:hypothetical protein
VSNFLIHLCGWDHLDVARTGPKNFFWSAGLLVLPPIYKGTKIRESKQTKIKKKDSLEKFLYLNIFFKKLFSFISNLFGVLAVFCNL